MSSPEMRWSSLRLSVNYPMWEIHSRERDVPEDSMEKR
jgi:hypothetical protein